MSCPVGLLPPFVTLNELLPERLGVEWLQISVPREVTVESEVDGHAEVFESRLGITGPRKSLGGTVSDVGTLNTRVHRCRVCVSTVGKALFLNRFFSLDDRFSCGIEIDSGQGACGKRSAHHQGHSKHSAMHMNRDFHFASQPGGSVHRFA
ncbi:MAG: hypothetical protein DMG54_35970 [Acidobacteria bacterium]|nr:MAG: hypothetical protein DMG54_35970 [Acidobacteriota bacterium]